MIPTWEKEAVAELEAEYHKLSIDAKELFHDRILEWQLHPGWVVTGTFLLGLIVGWAVL